MTEIPISSRAASSNAASHTSSSHTAASGTHLQNGNAAPMSSTPMTSTPTSMPSNSLANAPSAPEVEAVAADCDEAPRYRQSCFWARWRLRLTMLGMLLLPFVAWHFSNVRWTSWSFPLGVLVSICGVTIRLWAAGWLRKHEALATDGPYGWVRHPLYVGTGLAALGQGLMSGVPLAALGFPLFWLFLYRPAIAEEEAFLCRKYPGEYEKFRQKVPALVPLSKRSNQSQNCADPVEKTNDVDASRGSFSWSQAWCNREYEGVLLNVVAIAVYSWLHFFKG